MPAVKPPAGGPPRQAPCRTPPPLERFVTRDVAPTPTPTPPLPLSFPLAQTVCVVSDVTVFTLATVRTTAMGVGSGCAEARPWPWPVPMYALTPPTAPGGPPCRYPRRRLPPSVPCRDGGSGMGGLWEALGWVGYRLRVTAVVGPISTALRGDGGGRRCQVGCDVWGQALGVGKTALDVWAVWQGGSAGGETVHPVLNHKKTKKTNGDLRRVISSLL